MKERISIIISIVACLSMLFGINAKAETYKWPATKNIQTYVKSSGNDTTVYQTALSTKKYGTIYATDLITINGYSLSRLKVTYPISGGTKTGYIPVSAVTSGKINKATSKWTASSKITTYRRSGGGLTMGYIAKDDVCYTVATSDSWQQVIYPVSGGWKMGWIEDKPTQNTATIETASNWQYPMKNSYCTWKSYSNMSWASYNENSSGRNYHLGIDIYGTAGKIYAPAEGKIVACSSSNKGANGRYVIIQHSLNGKTVYSFYAHLSSVKVSKGQTVDKATQIGVAGGSGYGKNNNYGTHLHFAVVDTLWSSGGYYGYSTKFSGNKRYYKGVTYYNPNYVIQYNKLP